MGDCDVMGCSIEWLSVILAVIGAPRSTRQKPGHGSIRIAHRKYNRQMDGWGTQVVDHIDNSMSYNVRKIQDCLPRKK
jgi:hypothetical protein